MNGAVKEEETDDREEGEDQGEDQGEDEDLEEDEDQVVDVRLTFFTLLGGYFRNSILPARLVSASLFIKTYAGR